MEKLKTCSGHEGIDRISELLEHIIHHIMEFLPRYDGDTTRISILSKKFFSIWCSFPEVDFDFCYTPKLKVWDTDYVLNSIQCRLQHLILCKNNNICLQRLRFIARLHDGFDSNSNSRIVEMIDFALQNQVKELHMINDEQLNYKHYQNLLVKLPCFPEPVFSAKSITSLKLRGFNLAAEGHAQHITLSSPLIEKFTLRFCSGITSITLRGPKLSNVSVEDCYGLEMIQVDGPTTSLDCLEYVGRNCCDINLASIKSVKSIKLVGTDVTDQWLNSKSCRIVECLSFLCCIFPVKNTRWYFNHLKRLTFIDCKFKLVEFRTPNLECFSYSGTMYWYFPLLISSHRIEASIRVPDWELSRKSYLIGFLDLLSRLSHCQCQTLTIHHRSVTQEVIYPTTTRQQ